MQRQKKKKKSFVLPAPWGSTTPEWTTLARTRRRQDTNGDISEEVGSQDVLEDVNETEEQECETRFILLTVFTGNLLVIGIIYGSISYAVTGSAFINKIKTS